MCISPPRPRPLHMLIRELLAQAFLLWACTRQRVRGSGDGLMLGCDDQISTLYIGAELRNPSRAPVNVGLTEDSMQPSACR